ncbi:DNA adenine methylase [bacterium]|nr:DNA adenine methylase [bacterium]
MPKNKSPLRYPGGKTRACKKLDAIFTKYFNQQEITTIISPFFGGGSFEFYLQQIHGYTILANDAFNPLANFWHVCKTNKTELCKQLISRLKTPVTKEDFHQYRAQIQKTTDELTSAFYYFILNRCSFSGATLCGGFSKQASEGRFTKSSVDRINALDLTQFQISNQNFDTFLGHVLPPLRAEGGSGGASPSHICIFLDPPYYLEKKSKLYGKGGDMHINFDHMQLFNAIKDKKGWFMTYNDCEFIRDLYKDFIILEENWSYGMNKSKKSSEIVVVNPWAPPL